MIKTVNLRKEFGGKAAVRGIDLEVPPGEFFCLVGPNAAGKTTTIKMLVGLLQPTSGEIFIGGHDISSSFTEAKRLISYVPDASYLYDKLTAGEFLRFIGGVYEMDDGEQSRKSAALLEKFGLAEARDTLVENYSHGMRQRLVFCAAFLHEPRLIVIDEPMVGLDPGAIKLVKNSLREKAGEGVSIFMSTHTLAIPEEISDRVGIMNRGELVAVGTVEEIRKQTGQGAGTLEDLFLNLTGAG